TTGFGIGFAIGELDGRRRIGHGGAIYGFATELAFLPNEKLGVVAVTTLDVANVVVERIADHALRAMLAARAGEAPPAPDTTHALADGLAAALEGRYEGKGGEIGRASCRERVESAAAAGAVRPRSETDARARAP